MLMNKNVVLKIYHKRKAFAEGYQEFNMLFKANNAPSSVRVYNIMYNSAGSFLALSLEDLSSYSTLYDVCENRRFSKASLLLVARNMSRALAELH